MIAVYTILMAKAQSNAIEEIKATEAAFAKLLAEKGFAIAFSSFADSNAVIKRENDTLIKGPTAIYNYHYSKKTKDKISLTWAPDFVYVSENADLAYTYGKFIWKVIDETGKSSQQTGIFHTVWKKQKDGTWKFVWD